ncbi:MAG: lactate utilization protein [Christensenellales bacterium]|jgi:hypothetical protein
MNEKLTALAEKMKKRGFRARVFSSGEDALDALVEALSDAKTVGQGGSMTCDNLGVGRRLIEEGKTFHYHGNQPDPQSANEQREAALMCDAYILSANAVTSDGALYNIDGHGNRVANSIYHHPKGVFFLIGRNKIVDGGHEETMERMKSIACVLNNKRLKRQNPCVKSGVCSDCTSPNRICNVTVIIEYPASSVDTYVYLIDEDLGY